jgi:hypothetical protein
LKPPEPFTFLIDRCLGRVAVPDAIRAILEGGERVEHLDEHFPQNAKDDEWITAIGQRGWIILTKASALRRNPLEIAAMKSAETAVFIFANANAKSEQVAAGFRIALPRIRRATRRFAVPVLGRVNLAGELAVMWSGGVEHAPPKRIK